jgi:hypothetical protein
VCCACVCVCVRLYLHWSPTFEQVAVGKQTRRNKIVVKTKKKCRHITSDIEHISLSGAVATTTSLT